MQTRYVLVAAWLLTPSWVTAQQVDYLKEVKPLLAVKCYACHGSLAQKSKLRLDTVPLMLKGGRHGPAIAPGKAKESLLIAKVHGQDETLMPPEGEGERLTSAEIAVLTRWIDEGARAPDEVTPPTPAEHWAFQPPRRPPLPQLSESSWARNPIDVFLAHEHRKQGLVPAPAADKATLLRRVHVDLIGMPPDREQLHAFLNNQSSDAYEKVVEQLLASPHHGERWARHWMDVWRYSDWAGYKQELRYSQKYIWRWRNWIIESLNEDRGYDRMVVEMLAADEAYPEDADAHRATGFLARGYYKFNRDMWMDNVVEHTFKAFAGITINCAKCHDHKYDPIRQADYYRARAFFEPYNVRVDPVPGELDASKDGLPRIYDAELTKATYLYEQGNEKKPVKDRPLAPGLPEALGELPPIEPVKLPPVAFNPQLREFALAEHLARAQAALKTAEAQATRERAGRPKVAEARTKGAKANLLAMQARIEAERAKYADPPGEKYTQLASTAARAEREAAFAQAELALLESTHAFESAKAAVKPKDKKSEDALAQAGKNLDAAKKGHEQARAALAKTDGNYTPLGKEYPRTSTGRRLALARWLTDRQNPLTARVAVNQIWMRHFGTPLVENVFDFGLRSERPPHADLLDWLAVELIESGWSMKHLHQMIVTSSAYRMQSSPRGVAGANLTIDPDNAYYWRMNPRRMEAEVVRDSVLAVAGNLDRRLGGPDLDHEQGLVLPRRSVYFRHAYEKKMTMLEIFDGPNEEDCYRRSESIAPQQALALVNSTFSLEQARLLARRLHGESAEPGEFIRTAFECVLGRSPTVEETTVCQSFLSEQALKLSRPETLTPSSSGVSNRVPPASDPHLRARENLIHVLLNHNDFVTVR